MLLEELDPKNCLIGPAIGPRPLMVGASKFKGFPSSQERERW